MSKFRDMQEQATFHAGREYEREILAKRIEELERLNLELCNELKSQVKALMKFHKKNFNFMEQAERITELEAVIQKCIDAMKGSNCLEEQWLTEALKG